MANFTLREPPEENADPKEILSWCRELYENLWLIDFISVQQRKNAKGKEDE